MDNLEQLEATGRFIGRIHQFSRQGSFQHRDLVNPQVLGDESLLWLKESGHVPSSLVLPYFTIVEQVLDRSKEIWSQQNPKQIRLHGDLHPEISSGHLTAQVLSILMMHVQGLQFRICG